MSLLNRSNSHHELASHRTQEILAMIMIGDGVLAALQPKRHCMLWARGPKSWKHFVGWFAEHPHATRALGVAEAAAGVLWASRQKPVKRSLLSAALGR